MIANPVSIESLNQGLDQLFAYRQEKGQSGEGEWDFNNSLYTRLEDYRLRGLDETFWAFLVDELWRWRAIRPLTKQQIRDRGLAQLSDLKRCVDRLTMGSDHTLPTIEAVEWDDVFPLFAVAQQIKPVIGASKSMFASKLCHFLVPSAYLVTDGTLVKRGWKDYRQYWEECRTAWLRQPDKHKVTMELQARMPNNCKPCHTYPWATKISELCQFDVK